MKSVSGSNQMFMFGLFVVCVACGENSGERGNQNGGRKSRIFIQNS